MVKSCAAYNCKNIFSKGNGRSFHRFPAKNPSLCAEWVRQMRREEGFQPAYHFLCSDHFERNCFLKNYVNKTLLKDDAIPTIFSFSKYHVKVPAPTQKTREDLEEPGKTEARSNKMGNPVSSTSSARYKPIFEHSYTMSPNTSDVQVNEKRETNLDSNGSQMGKFLIAPKIFISQVLSALSEKIEMPALEMCDAASGSAVCPHYVALFEEKAKSHKLEKEINILKDTLKKSNNDIQKLKEEIQNLKHFQMECDEPLIDIKTEPDDRPKQEIFDVKEEFITEEIYVKEEIVITEELFVKGQVEDEDI